MEVLALTELTICLGSPLKLNNTGMRGIPKTNTAMISIFNDCLTRATLTWSSIYLPDTREELFYGLDQNGLLQLDRNDHIMFRNDKLAVCVCAF